VPRDAVLLVGLWYVDVEDSLSIMFIEQIMHDCGIPLIGGGVDQPVDPSTSSIIFQCSDLEAFISRKPLVLEELSLSSISYTVDDPFFSSSRLNSTHFHIRKHRVQ
jgi:hypothetical protein